VSDAEMALHAETRAHAEQSDITKLSDLILHETTISLIEDN